MIVERGEINTFGDQAHDIFNNLQKSIGVIKDRNVFIKKLNDIIEIKLLEDSYLSNIKLTTMVF